MRNFILLLPFIFLQGCTLETLSTHLNQDNGVCHIPQKRLQRLQQTEKQFLTNEKQRSRILRTALKTKEHAQIALLLSTPLASTQQLQQAKRHYKQVAVNPQPHCLGDQYIDLRNQFTNTLLWMRAEQDQVEHNNHILQTKINALTQIESDLNRQREAQ